MGFLKKPSIASIKLPSSKPSPAVEAVAHPLPSTPSSNSVRSSTNNNTEEERRDDGSGSSGLQGDAESCSMSVSSKKKDKISSATSVTPSRASVSSKRKDKHSSASSVTPSRAPVSSKKKDKSSSTSSVTPSRASTSASKKKDKSSNQEAMKETKNETPAKKESPAPTSSPDNIEQQQQPSSPKAKSASRHGTDKSSSKSRSKADISPSKKMAPATSLLDKEKSRHERPSVSPRQSRSKSVRGTDRGNSKHRSDKSHRSRTSRSSSKHRSSHHDRSSSRSRKQPVSSRDKERSASSRRRRAPKNDAEDYAMEMEWKEARRKQQRERRRKKEKLRASIEESDDESSSGDDDDDGTFADDESKRENDETTTMWNDASNLVINASHFFRNLTIAEDASRSLVTDGASIDDDATLLTRDMSNIEEIDTQYVSEEDDDDEGGKTEGGTPATNEELIETTCYDAAMTKSHRSRGSKGSRAQSAVTAKVSNTNKSGSGALLKDKFRMARSISMSPRKDRKETIAEDDGVEVDAAAIGDKNGEAVALPAVKGAKSKDSIVHSNEDKTDDDKTDDDKTDDGDAADETATQDTGSTMESNEATPLDTYIEKMEEFTAENHEHQLQVNVVEHGHIEKMLLQELPYIPKPYRSDEILVKIEASTVTLQDCMIRRGKWYEMQPLPFVPGSDFVGIILEMGDVAAANSPHRLGDKVAAIVPNGGNAKYITLPYDKVIQVPQEIDSGLALCLSSAYVPAREAMDLARKMNTPFTDANILVIGGNGPSGLAAIELALLEGANVFTTADERHHKFLNGMGAKCHPVDPKKWLPTLGGKMDVVLDSVCLDGYESSRAALNSAGMLVCTGLSAVYTQGRMQAYGLSDVRDLKAMHCKMQAKYMWKNAVYYERMERYNLAPNEYAQHVSYLCHLAAKGFITPLVSARAPLNMVPSMQKAIEHVDTTYGVCVCTPWVTEIPYENGMPAAET